MLGDKATHLATLAARRAVTERCNRKTAEALAVLERTILKNHPENITPKTYAQLRRIYLDVIRACRENAIATADLLKAIGEFGHDSDSRRGDSGSD